MKFIFSDKPNFAENANIIFLMTEDFAKTKLCKEGCKCSVSICFSGKENETYLTVNPLTGQISVLYGLGDENKLNPVKLEKIGNKLYDFAKAQKFEKIILVFNGKLDCHGVLDYTDKPEYLLNIINGMQLTDYSFDKYKTKKKEDENELKEVFVLTESKTIEKSFKELELVKQNVFFCRDLVNEPANELNPNTYSELCKNIKGAEVEILDDKELKKLGMNCILAVGQGSEIKPKLVVLKYKGNKSEKIDIAIVGKGITFDSGGIDIKPDNAMYDMKCDMAGSAVAVSTIKLLSERKAKVNAVAVVPLVENMPSGSAIKPADIVKSLSGQTVEILHTDAEGRLILADALYYAETRFKPTTIIDLATLTGAICVALGEKYAGIFTNNDDLANEIAEASKNTGECSWRMPLEGEGEYFDEMMDSDVADVKNISGIRFGGAITAGEFLQRFINKHNKWAHIDIAGTAFITKENFFVKKDATGYGVRLLNDLIKNHYEK